MKDDSRGVSYVGEKMKTQAISMPLSANQAYTTRKGNDKTNFNAGCTCMVVPVYQAQEDTFVKWAAKNVSAGAAFSLLFDLGTNAVAHFSKNVESIPTKEIFKNVPKVAGIFLLAGGVFKAISNIIDK